MTTIKTQSSALNSRTSSAFLTKDDELNLLTQFINYDCQISLATLVESQEGFIRKIAHGYKNYGLPIGDLIQEGTIGLIKAIQRFDPEREVRLITFASHWVKAEIHEFIIKNVKSVKVATTKNQRKLFFNLRKLSKAEGWLTQAEAQEIADKLDVHVKEVFSMENRLRTNDQAFDVCASGEDDDLGASLFLVDNNSDIAGDFETSNLNNVNKSSLISAIGKLNNKEREIIQRRWLADKGDTLAVFAKERGVTVEAIRLTEKRAMIKLKNMITMH